MLLKLLLCRLLGWHKWVDDLSSRSHVKCKRCGEQRFVLKVLFASDARRLGVSEEAIERGYATKADFPMREKE